MNHPIISKAVSATLWAALLVPASATAGNLSGEVQNDNVAVVIRDVIELPATAAAPPLARLGILREAPDGSGRLFMNDLRGPLYVINDGVVSTYLDMSVLTPTLDTGNLQLGLVSFAFHPDFASNGLLYTAHTEDIGDPPNLVPALPAPIIHHAVVTEWQADDPAANVFSGSPRELMRIASPHPTHNLGEIAFDPALAPGDDDYGLLYIATGDFGSVQRNDPGQVQRLDTVYGAILRIDPLGSSFQRGGIVYKYGIPASNPFANDGNPDTFGEIYAYGFRNPQNFHFDRERPGRLWGTDIGQGNLEEVNLPAPGTNHGWPEREGTYALDVNVNREVVFDLPADDASFGFTYPPVQYDHDEGLAIAGVLTVRGGPPSALKDKLVFGDIVTGRLFYSDIDDALSADDGDPATTADVFELNLLRDGAATSLRQLIRDELNDQGINRTDLRFSSDSNGRLYVSTKQDGFVRELVPVPRVSGLNLYAPTAELARGIDSCFELLADLGGANQVASIASVIPGLQATEQCGYQAGTPTGVNFTLQAGSAYFVELTQVSELGLGTPDSCPATSLVPGANLIGIAQPRVGLDCYDLLVAFGQGVVTTVERANKNNDTFEVCGTADGNEPRGRNFPIRPGEGYIVHSSATAGVNLNDLSLPGCG